MVVAVTSDCHNSGLLVGGIPDFPLYTFGNTTPAAIMTG